VEGVIPMRVTATARSTATGRSHPDETTRLAAHHNTTVMAEAYVPGPGRK
jgi:hypothetical protein